MSVCRCKCRCKCRCMLHSAVLFSFQLAAWLCHCCRPRQNRAHGRFKVNIWAVDHPPTSDKIRSCSMVGCSSPKWSPSSPGGQVMGYTISWATCLSDRLTSLSRSYSHRVETTRTATRPLVHRSLLPKSTALCCSLYLIVVLVQLPVPASRAYQTSLFIALSCNYSPKLP